MSTISVTRPRLAAHHARAARATRPAPAPTPAGIPVLPAVDVTLGSVSFVTPTGPRQLFCAETPQLLVALGEAVRAPRWIPEISTLVVTVAQTGSREGRRLGFRLASY